ncbi:MAG: hypothetical protein M1836_004715 [Candelina mexicana]|nr:MAG: hypothetical protein M1836_004715 [Candelina mexicana]
MASIMCKLAAWTRGFGKVYDVAETIRQAIRVLPSRLRWQQVINSRHGSLSSIPFMSMCVFFYLGASQQPQLHHGDTDVTIKTTF